jgi:type II secretory pathway component PulF
MQFSYTARSGTGTSATGVIDATSVAEARQMLRAEGLYPLSVTGAKLPGLTVQKTRKPRKKKVRPTDLLMLTSQLSIMSKSGVDLADALKGIAQECPNLKLKQTLQNIYDDVAAGQTVSAALEKHKTLFGSTYIAGIRAGEASGRLPEVLDRLTSLQRYEIRLRNTIKSILTYPIILTCVALLVSSALILFVLPQFATVFEDLERSVPPTTQFLLDISVFVRTHLTLLIPSLLVGIFLIYRMLRTERYRMLMDRFLMQARGIGPAMQGLTTGRVFTLLGTMLESGIPLLDALKLCRTSVRNQLFQKLFDQLEDDVMNGKGIGLSLGTASFVPGGAAQMIATAERSGELGSVMQTVGEFYEEEGERQIREAVKFLEPAIILVMGVFVSFIVISVMLPMLDVSTMAK